MTKAGYKKYMKPGKQKDYSIVRLFLFTFFGMLLVFTFLIMSFSPSVDVSIGDYDNSEATEVNQNVDGRLTSIQEEDSGKSFSELMRNTNDMQTETIPDKTTETINNENFAIQEQPQIKQDEVKQPANELLYKVYIGTYTSAEQAKVAKDIILETNLNLNPIVKCLGSNNYTLQVGIFKNKVSAEYLLHTLQQNHLPGRITESN
ncbi:MAG: hypothetical protein MJ237_05580 [bacterium]|nr:hypothetical protein [bacterium]